MNPITYVANFYARELWRRRHRQSFGKVADDGTSRLLLDVSNIVRHDAKTGIQRVVRAIWRALDQASSARFVLAPVFATHRHGYCLAGPGVFNGELPREPAVPVVVQPNDVFLGLDLAAQYVPKYADQLLAWKRCGVTLNFLVYDLLPLTNPEWFNGRTATQFQRWFEFVTRWSDQAICISADVARRVGLRAGSRPQSAPLRVSSIRLGANLEESMPTAGISARTSQALAELSKVPTVLMVGTVEPRKAYDVALDAFEEIWRGDDRQLSLAIVGQYGWKADDVRTRILNHPEFGRRLWWLPDVSDEALAELYSLSKGLLVTSRAEGFGLPVIEALRHAKPVLARDLPVFRERVGADVSYFSDDSPATLAKAVECFVFDRRVARTDYDDLPTWADSARDILSAVSLSEAPISGEAPQQTLLQATTC